MDDTIFRILMLGLVAVTFGISMFYRTRAQRTGGEKIDRTQEGVPLMIALRLTGFGLWISVIVYILFPNALAFATLPFPTWLRWVGLALALIALPLIVWMFRSLGNNVTDTVQTRESAQLVMRGPYRWIRHPLYTFGGLFFIGLMLMAANAVLLILGGLALTFLVLRTPTEEAKLVDKFGDSYVDYMKHTGRFLPKRAAQ